MTFLRRQTKAGSDAARDDYLHGQAQKEHAQDEADRRNGALMRKDAHLVRLLKAYSKCSAENRAALLRIAEAAASAPGGIT